MAAGKRFVYIVKLSVESTTANEKEKNIIVPESEQCTKVTTIYSELLTGSEKKRFFI